MHIDPCLLTILSFELHLTVSHLMELLQLTSCDFRVNTSQVMTTFAAIKESNIILHHTRNWINAH